MYLREVLNILNTKMPSKLREEEWILYLNSAIRRYGRDIAKEDYLRFDAASGVKIYPIPKYAADGIKAVTVGGRGIKIKLYDEADTDDYCIVSPTGYIALSFYPKGGERVCIMFSCARRYDTWQDTLNREDIGDAQRKDIYDCQECGVYDDFTDAVILGAMAEYAEAAEDTAAADNYRQQAETIVKCARQSRYAKRGKYPKTRVVENTRWKRRL